MDSFSKRHVKMSFTGCWGERNNIFKTMSMVFRCKLHFNYLWLLTRSQGQGFTSFLFLHEASNPPDCKLRFCIYQVKTLHWFSDTNQFFFLDGSVSPKKREFWGRVCSSQVTWRNALLCRKRQFQIQSTSSGTTHIII